jgi:hypothetical protein
MNYPHPQPQAHIHQIFYSEQTRAELDQGFIPLDNIANERPDWREYWPIRSYLMRNELAEHDLYGFLSPKFKEKTGLTAQQVRSFALQTAHDIDVLIFSPYIDQSALFVNTFEHAETIHPGIWDVAQNVIDALGLRIDLRTVVMNSSTAIFCNFFAAKPKFWRRWLELNERMFQIAESNDTDLARRLNALTSYPRGSLPMKIFIQERIASLILATDPEWKTRAYNPYQLPTLLQRSDLEFNFLMCDALKIGYRITGFREYMVTYDRLREQISRKLAGPQEKAR